MTSKDGLSYLEAQIGARIAGLDASRRFYMRGSWVQTVATALLGALTTLVVGLNQIYKSQALAAVSLALAGLTTVAAAASGWFSFRKRWVSSQLTLNQLNRLQSDIAYQRASDATMFDTASVDAYYARYQHILDEFAQEWEAAGSAGPR